MSSQSTSHLCQAPETVASSHRAGTFLAIVVLLLVSFAPLVAVADLPSEARGTLAAVFPPGTDKTEVLAAVAEADGLVVREGGWGTVLVAHSDESGFARRLRQAGAWLMVDPLTAAGCLIAGDINRIK